MIELTHASNPSLATAALKGTLTFGRTLADLMAVISHTPSRGWHDARIVPFGPLSLSPAAKTLHYGLEIFEGHKAFMLADGSPALFRPELNARRLNISAARIGMPTVPEALQLETVHTLVDALRGWIPKPNGALYLRPALIASEGSLGVGPASEHLYFVIASPVGGYFTGSKETISVKVETELTRAALGGVGFAKTGGNYAASMTSKITAKKEGFDEVLWLDARHRRYLEELSAMNVFIVEKGVLITPPISETILDGITRKSLITLARDFGVSVEERPINIEEVARGIASGTVSEMMAVGTAAAVTPIGELGIDNARLTVGDGKTGALSQKLRDRFLDIQYGRSPDKFNWMQRVERVVSSRYPLEINPQLTGISQTP